MNEANVGHDRGRGRSWAARAPARWPRAAPRRGSRAIARCCRTAIPAELMVARGEEIWKTKRGPKNVSLEQCDLGIGPGVIKGAYAQMPRYFADADQVDGLRVPLVWCMVKLQGMDRAAITQEPVFGRRPDGRRTSRRWLPIGAEMSRGMPVNMSQGHPKEKASFDRGKLGVLHARRTIRLLLRHLPRRHRAAHPPAGPAQHLWQQGGRRSRVHDLAGLPRVAGRAALDAVAPERLLPAAALPDLVFLSPTSIDLITFLGVNANGAKMDAPAIKR